MDTPKYERAAELARAGLPSRDIAREMGVTRKEATRYLNYARQRDALPPLTTQKDAGGTKTWRYLNNKGAAPQAGSLSTAMSYLSKADIYALLDEMRPDEPTLAHTLGRLLKEHLDDSSKTR